eukprot:SM000092S24527  [mRNA]  locus=s92:468821:473303:- [translate_table: standard]
MAALPIFFVTYWFSCLQSTHRPGERTVRRLKLSKALTIPDTTTIADACRRMAARRVDAALLTDSNALLCGIVTDKDIALRVIAEGRSVDDTPVSAVMTRNPLFVNIDTSAVEALQKMVTGRFRHLPVVENNEVVALLDITKCLYDAIARMERAAEKGNAIAAAVEGVEREFGNTISAPSTFIDTLRERMFRPTLATLVGDQSRVAIATPGDSVFAAAKQMREAKSSAVIVTNESSSKPLGILTTKDILLRVVAMNRSPNETPISQVMTASPECAVLDTTVVDALHIMHDGKFLHLPIVDRDGNVVACVDVIQLTHGAVATAVGNAGSAAEAASNMMQKFWDSTLALDAAEDEDETRQGGFVYDSEISHPNGLRGGAQVDHVFSFKMEDLKGRVHRFSCGTESLTELVVAVAGRLGSDFDPDNPPSVLYEDDEKDKVLLNSDEDLAAAVSFARTTGLKSLKLVFDFSEAPTENLRKASKEVKNERSGSTTTSRYIRNVVLVTAVACVAGAALYHSKYREQVEASLEPLRKYFRRPPHHRLA